MLARARPQSRLDTSSISDHILLIQLIDEFAPKTTTADAFVKFVCLCYSMAHENLWSCRF